MTLDADEHADQHGDADQYADQHGDCYQLSYEYADHQYVYALWSQGFRRGGANSVPLSGPFQESPLLSTYKPDSTNNYETGLKGRFSNGISYTIDAFYIRWSNPQISASLPSGNLAVYNANTAVSKGFEFETSGPIPLVHGLAYSAGFSYADARLNSDFSLPAKSTISSNPPSVSLMMRLVTSASEGS